MIIPPYNYINTCESGHKIKCSHKHAIMPNQNPDWVNQCHLPTSVHIVDVKADMLRFFFLPR